MAGIVIKPRARILHGHDWVFSSEVLKVFGNPVDGDVISLKDGKDHLIGSAIYNSKSQIVARRFSRRRQDLDQGFFRRRIAQASEYRDRRNIDAKLRRVVWSESDGLPGVIIDRYGDDLVLQTLTLAMDMRKDLIVAAMVDLFGDIAIVERNDAPVRKAEGLELRSDSHLHRGGCQAAKVRETRRHFGLDPDRPVFGMLGRLTPQKRPLDLCALAKRIGPDIQFTWTGLGELAESFVNAAAVLPNVVLVPAQTDVRPIYEMLDGLIITSKFEGLPVVLLEALSMGVPALSTDVGAIREVLERYSAGMVFSPPGDMVALERAFRTFVHNLEKFKAAAIDARDRVKEEFSSARMARDYDACFRRAISGRITGTVRSL